MSNTSRHSVEQLKQALTISEKIQQLEAQLAAILGSPGAPKVKRAYNKKTKPAAAKPAAAKSAAATPARKKRVISEEGKKRIAAAQRARWAKLKKPKKE